MPLAVHLTTRDWLTVAGLTLLAAAALGAGFSALLAEQGRRAVLGRLCAPTAGRAERQRVDDVLHGVTSGRWAALARWLDGWIPRAIVPADAVTRLAPAGLDHRTAPVIFAAARLACMLVMPALAWAVTAPLGVSPVIGAAVGIVAGLALPDAVVARLATRRQARLRAALPDAIDLLVVCLEAGVSLDAALLRVARDLASTHPALAAELSDVNGRVAAGIPREEALGGLYARTGLEELRSLASTMVQGERWGTSLARVLRIHAETLRTRRRQLAEARAAEASVKMIMPLVLFLLPAFFAVVLGPAVLNIGSAFAGP